MKPSVVTEWFMLMFGIWKPNLSKSILTCLVEFTNKPLLHFSDFGKHRDQDTDEKVSGGALPGDDEKKDQPRQT